LLSSVGSSSRPDDVEHWKPFKAMESKEVIMSCGFHNKILRVDLSNRQISVE